MKTLLLLLSLAIATNGISQVKKDNTIILPAVSAEKIKDVLFLNGYTTTSTDTTYIATTSKEISKSSMLVKLMFLKTADGRTFLKGLSKYTSSIQIKFL